MKITRTLRVLLVLMALVMILPLAVACKKDKNPPAETDAPSTEAPTQETPRGPFDPPLIKVDSNASVYSGTPDTSWYTGDKTEYTLTSADQFVGFHALRSETCTFEGVTIKLGCDMIINKGTTEEIKARGASNYAWKNLDSKHLFKGNIDGQGHTISGVYMQLTDEGNASMFGSVAGTVTLKNFNLTNSYFGAPNAAEGKEVLAGLVSTVTEEGTKLRISKVNLEITIEESGKKFNKAAGFVGCVDGKVNVTIDNSNFNGKIAITGTHAAGFIAHIPGALSIVRVTTCTNYAEIATAQYCGGMIGQSKSQDMQTLDSFNRGELKCDLNCKNLTGEQITLYDPYEGAHPPIKEGTTGIRVLSFNVRMDLPHTDGVLSNAALNRVAAVKNEILYYTPDLIGLQEDTVYWLNNLKLPDYNVIPSSTKGENCAIYYKKGMKLLDSGNYWLTADGTDGTVALSYADVTDPNGPYYLTDTEREQLMIDEDSDLKAGKKKYWDEATGQFVTGTTSYYCGTNRKFTYGVFEVNGQILIYINTHLTQRNQGADYANAAFNKVRSHSRLKEWDILMGHLVEIEKKYPDSLVFFTGDFNDYSDQPIYKHVTEDYGYFNANAETPEHIGSIGSWNGAFDVTKQGDTYPATKKDEGKENDYVDYCFFEKGLTVERFTVGQGRADILDVATGKPKTIYTSDHRAMITDLSFKTATTGKPIVPDHTGTETEPETKPEVDLSKPSIYSGTSDISWYTGDKTEYILTTAEQFAGFLDIRQTSKGSTTFEGVTIKLARDLIFNQGTVEEFLKNEPYQLRALASSYLFKGIFDGQGHTISGIYLQCTGNGVKGLFGGIGDNAVIKDLTLENCYAGSANVAKKNTLGILAARISGKNVLISNVKITNFLMKESTESFPAIGAFVGRVDKEASLTIENCHTTNGTLDFAAKGSRIGSLVGEVQASATLTVKGCTSDANISGTDLCGGLVGNTSGTTTFDDKCSYTGTITCPGTKGDLISNP